MQLRADSQPHRPKHLSSPSSLDTFLVKPSRRQAHPSIWRACRSIHACQPANKHSRCVGSLDLVPGRQRLEVCHRPRRDLSGLPTLYKTVDRQRMYTTRAKYARVRKAKRRQRLAAAVCCQTASSGDSRVVGTEWKGLYWMWRRRLRSCHKRHRRLAVTWCI